MNRLQWIWKHWNLKLLQITQLLLCDWAWGPSCGTPVCLGVALWLIYLVVWLQRYSSNVSKYAVEIFHFTIWDSEFRSGEWWKPLRLSNVKCYGQNLKKFGLWWTICTASKLAPHPQADHRKFMKLMCETFDQQQGFCPAPLSMLLISNGISHKYHT